MTIRLSTGMVNSMCDGGAGNGIKAGLAAGFVYIYQGSQPADADTGAGSALQLGKVTNNDDGTTGIQFDATVAGVVSKAAAQTWKFHGLAAGVAGWFRFSDSADNPVNTSATAKRIDGTIGTSGADMNITNTTIALSAVTTIDSWSFTLPKS
jgi:hypothetical protein